MFHLLGDATTTIDGVDYLKFLTNGSPVVAICGLAIWLVPRVLAHLSETTNRFSEVIKSVQAEAKDQRDVFARSIDKNTDALLTHSTKLGELAAHIQVLNKS